MTRPLAGIFVGGESRRMGGRPKGLLKAPDGGTLVARWRTILGALDVDVVLVGRHGAYAAIDLDVVEDARLGIGPLGGLTALLERAERTGAASALALACDMPYVTRALVERLLAAPPAPAVAPKRDGRWEPLFARYDPVAVLPIARQRAGGRDYALGRLLDQSRAVALDLAADEHPLLEDWDTPEDL